MSHFQENIETEIKSVLVTCVENTFKRIAKKERENKLRKPFHEALLAKEFVRLSSFERSFSTSFGQGAIESISKLVAQSNGYAATRQKETMVNVYRGAIDEVERICSRLRDGSTQPNWERELKLVKAHQKGATEVRRVISDLWLEKENKILHFSIKTVRPNLDQSESAKKDMLLLSAHLPKSEAYFALYYNPDGESASDYRHSFAQKIFNTASDKCVLIGKDYWDLLGGEGSYEALLELFEEVGKKTRTRLLPEIL